jgi:hypothetical protein
MDNARLGDGIAEIFSTRLMQPQKHIILAGFEDLTPQQQIIIDAAIKAGAELYAQEQIPQNRSQIRMAFADTESELTAAANWAKNHLEAAPVSRIGVIVPELAKERYKVIRIFDDVFHPSLVVSTKNPSRRMYNMSLGQPLSHYPVICDALLFLHMALSNNAGFDQYSQMLRSPFWEGRQEFTKGRFLMRYPVSDLIFQSNGFEIVQGPPVPDTRHLPVLVDRITGFLRLIEEMLDTQKPSLWARLRVCPMPRLRERVLTATNSRLWLHGGGAHNSPR